jgi:hypothetical protein
MVVFFLASTDEKDAVYKNHATGMLFASFFMVMFQICTVCGVLTGTILPSCATNYQCKEAQEEGTFCELKTISATGERDSSRNNRCNYCGEAPFYSLLLVSAESCSALLRPPAHRLACAHSCSLPRQPGEVNQRPGHQNLNATKVEYMCKNPTELITEGYVGGADRLVSPMGSYEPAAIESWCTGCVDPLTYEAGVMTQLDVMTSNVSGMGPFDIITLLFATMVIALHVVAELKGIELVNYAISHAERSKEMGGPLDLGKHAGVLRIINGLRRWVFLPTLVGAIPVLIAFKGGDALSLCMNTVAILFLTEIDDVLFNYGVGERVRERAKIAGRVVLGRDEEEAIVRTKATHGVLLCVSVILAVQRMGNATDGYAVGVGIQFLSFGVGGVLEQMHRADKTAFQKTSGSVEVAFKCFMGFLVFGYILDYSGHSLSASEYGMQ